MLMRIQLDGLADEAAYALSIRDWLHSRRRIAARRRLIATLGTRSACTTASARSRRGCASDADVDRTRRRSVGEQDAQIRRQVARNQLVGCGLQLIESPPPASGQV